MISPISTPLAEEIPMQMNGYNIGLANNDEWARVIDEFDWANYADFAKFYLCFPDIKIATATGPFFTCSAGPCTAGIVFTNHDAAYIFHFVPDILNISDYLYSKVGLYPEDIRCGVYGSDGITMLQGLNSRYATEWGLTEVAVPSDALTIDWYINTVKKEIKYHFNF